MRFVIGNNTFNILKDHLLIVLSVASLMPVSNSRGSVSSCQLSNTCQSTQAHCRMHAVGVARMSVATLSIILHMGGKLIDLLCLTQKVLEALARGTNVIFRLDIQGAHTVRRKFPDAVSIFLVGC